MENKINKPTEDEYIYAERKIIYAQAPVIYPCQTCGWPVINGFVCNTCGESNPQGDNKSW